MDDFVIHNVRIVRPEQGIHEGYLRVNRGSIAEVGNGDSPEGFTGDRIDGGKRLLTPGLVDIHTHGIHAFNYDQGPDHLTDAAEVLGRYGTTTVVPTIVPKSSPDFLESLTEFTDAIPHVTKISVPGIHLEGPFVAIAGAACETRDGDLALLDEMLDACGGRVSVMSIAPEVPNIIPVIEALVEKHVVPFITHTRASVEQTVSAIDAGARHATHFYDVFPVPEETDPGVRPVGVVETILADRRATCDFICDGVHVNPMAVRAAVAAKGWDGVSLITDASFGAGLGPGKYDTPWGYSVEVRPGDAPRIADPDHPMYGALAGSALTMNKGVSNLLSWLDLPPERVWAMGTRNPARVIGADTKGDLEVGMDADMVLWSEENGALRAERTWVAGRVVHDATEKVV